MWRGWAHHDHHQDQHQEQRESPRRRRQHRRQRTQCRCRRCRRRRSPPPRRSSHWWWWWRGGRRCCDGGIWLVGWLGGIHEEVGRKGDERAGSRRRCDARAGVVLGAASKVEIFVAQRNRRTRMANGSSRPRGCIFSRCSSTYTAFPALAGFGLPGEASANPFPKHTLPINSRDSRKRPGRLVLHLCAIKSNTYAHLVSPRASSEAFGTRTMIRGAGWRSTKLVFFARKGRVFLSTRRAT